MLKQEQPDFYIPEEINIIFADIKKIKTCEKQKYQRRNCVLDQS